MKRSFRFHVSNYAVAEILATIAGLLSFPILTRLLSVADYGTINLVASALLFTTAFGKLGVQQAALRTYSEVNSGRSPYSMAQFESTVFWGMTASGLVVMVLWAGAVLAIPVAWWGGGGESVTWIMLLAAPLIVVRVLDSALMSQLRAREQSMALAIYGSARRYAVLVLIIGVLMLVRRDLVGFYVATIVVEVGALMALFAWMHAKRPNPSPRDFSRPLYLSLAAFGLPMFGTEVSNVVLVMSDRYIIQMKMDAESLGLYAASYNMCDYVRGALLGAMTAAAYPTCMRLWESEGPKALTRFLSTFMHFYVAAAFFVILVLSSVGAEMMTLLASAKYRAGSTAIPWIVSAMALQSLLTVVGVGLFLTKRTKAIMLLVLVGGVASIGANFVLVPLLGIRGAAISMLLVNLLLGVAYYVFARDLVRIEFPFRALATFGPIAIAAYLVGTRVALPSEVGTLIARTLAASGVYVLGAIALDGAVRAKAAQVLQRFGRKKAS